LEWLDPPFCGGHWVPEMVELAGGQDVLGVPGRPSRRVDWDEVIAADPDVIILMPCGFDVARTLASLKELEAEPRWARLRAVRQQRVYAVDANAYFSRPGPRLVDGLELLARILHPERFGEPAAVPGLRPALAVAALSDLRHPF
ncbi:MAG TPA: ABC transporter substrate-binding protein, partial [Bacillota bacterium]